MALTERKRLFADALLRGERKADAARQAGYSPATASQMANKLGKDPDVLRYMETKRAIEQAKAQAQAEGKRLELPDLTRLFSDPRDFLMALMNDAGEEMKLRVDAAKALMPFMHQKKGEGGKKEQRQEDAKKVAGRFSPAAPPKLAAANGKRL